MRRHKLKYKPHYDFKPKMTLSYRTTLNLEDALEEFKETIFKHSNHVVFNCGDFFEFTIEGITTNN
jgi:hypothetical protein